MSWRYWGKARKVYECMMCGLNIEIGEHYHRGVISCGSSLFVERYHSECPSTREFEEFVRKEEEQEKEQEASKLEISLAA